MKIYILINTNNEMICFLHKHNEKPVNSSLLSKHVFFRFHEKTCKTRNHEKHVINAKIELTCFAMLRMLNTCKSNGLCLDM